MSNKHTIMVDSITCSNFNTCYENNNKQGRPRIETIMAFSAPPQSIVSKMLCRINKNKFHDPNEIEQFHSTHNKCEGKKSTAIMNIDTSILSGRNKNCKRKKPNKPLLSNELLKHKNINWNILKGVICKICKHSTQYVLTLALNMNSLITVERVPSDLCNPLNIAIFDCAYTSRNLSGGYNAYPYNAFLDH